MEPLDETQEQFRVHALGYWMALRDNSADEANRHTDAGDVIVRGWTTDGVVVERLRPLLNDPKVEVQFAAASHLAGVGDSLALETLERLATEPAGLVAPSARLRLMALRREK